VTPLPRPLDQHRSDVAWFHGEGGRCPAGSLINHASRRSPLRSFSTVGFLIGHASQRSPLQSSSAVGWPSPFAQPLAHPPPVGVDIVDDLRRSSPRSSSAVGRPDLCVVPGTSTSGGVDTMDELLGAAAIGPLLPHHDDGSSHGHRLGCIFWRVQPHHFQCR
jgi:hypothetical protein